MAGKQIRVLGNLLIKEGMSPDMPVAIIENTSRESKKVITQLAELKHHDNTRSGPVCIVIGEILKSYLQDEKPVERVESRRRKKYELTNAA
jgi:siroheme synthase